MSERTVCVLGVICYSFAEAMTLVCEWLVANGKDREALASLCASGRTVRHYLRDEFGIEAGPRRALHSNSNDARQGRLEMVPVQPRDGAIVGPPKDDEGEAPGVENDDARDGDVARLGRGFFFDPRESKLRVWRGNARIKVAPHFHRIGCSISDVPPKGLFQGKVVRGW